MNTTAKKYQCPTCEQKFIYFKAFQKHQQSHINNPNHFCPSCNSRLSTKKILQRHIIRQHSSPAFQCEECKKAFRSQFKLKTHMRVHTGELYGTCFCGRSFRDSSNYNRHVRTVHQPKQFKCPFCNKLFKQKYHVKRHIQNSCQQSWGFSCRGCSVWTTTFAELEAHQVKCGPYNRMVSLSSSSSSSFAPSLITPNLEEPPAAPIVPDFKAFLKQISLEELNKLYDNILKNN